MGIIKVIYGLEPGAFKLRVELLPMLSLWFGEGSSLCNVEFICSLAIAPQMVVSAGLWRTNLGVFIQTT